MVRNKAFEFIKKDEVLWKLWNEAKTDYERELLMTSVVFEQSFEEGYYSGYDDGQMDISYYGQG